MDSFIPWVGGKKLLRDKICSQFPENIKRYVEVFGGAGWVLFYKDKHANEEVFNDVNSNLINLFKCMKYHPEAIKEELEFMLNSRETFNEFVSLYNNTHLTDIQRATRYLYIIRTSYGAKRKDYGSKSRYIARTWDFTKFKERLNRVVIENKSYDAVIKQQDKIDTLFYCDPPYYKAEKFYGNGAFIFNEEEHIKLNELLQNIKGKCIVSYNNHDFIKDLYKSFNIIEIERQNNFVTRYNKNKIYKELIIKNY